MKELIQATGKFLKEVLKVILQDESVHNQNSDKKASD